jgi:hypothetical protein
MESVIALTLEFADVRASRAPSASHAIDAAFHHRGYEMEVARQAVELGDNELCLVPSTGCERLIELGASIALAAFYLGVLGDQPPGAPVEVVHDGLPGASLIMG